MIGEGAAENLKLIPDNIIYRRIGDVAEDFYDQLIGQLKQREFGLQLDESTDGSRNVHLTCCVRFVDFSKQNFVVELLFCQLIELGCRGSIIFNIIGNCISTNKLDWKNCISIGTDGAKAMSGSCCGLRSLVQDCASTARWMHCMIHRKALVA